MDIINKEKILEHAKKLTEEGRFDRAIDEYKKLLQLDPDDLRVKIKVAELHVKRKQVQEALRLYTEVARSYTAGGFFLKAATVYKNMLRLNPSLVDINIALSELYEKMGLVQDALYQYQIVATHYEQKNDQENAMSVREKMAMLDPENTSLKIRLAESYQMKGEVDRSLDLYEALAGKIKASGKIEQLIEIYSKILAHRPEKTDLLRELCHIHFKRGEWKEILKRMDSAKGFIAGDPELLAMQADIFARLNQLETAKGKYRDLSELLNRQGDPDGAIKAYDTIYFLSPEDEEDVRTAVEGIRTGAFEDVKRRVAERRKKVQDEETKKEMELHATEVAKKDLEETVKKGGAKFPPAADAAGALDAANVSYNLGSTYRKMGLLDEAKKEFEKALLGFRTAMASGIVNDEMIKRVEEIEGKAGQQANKTAIQQAGRPAGPQTDGKNKKEERIKKEKQIAGGKKKISFV